MSRIECNNLECGYRVCKGFESLVCPYCMVPFTRAALKIKEAQNNSGSVAGEQGTANSAMVPCQLHAPNKSCHVGILGLCGDKACLLSAQHQ
jgi:hypothetical protein